MPESTPFQTAVEAVEGGARWVADVTVDGPLPYDRLRDAVAAVAAAWRPLLGGELGCVATPDRLTLSLSAAGLDAASVDLSVRAVALACGGEAVAVPDTTLVDDYVDWQREVERDGLSPQSSLWRKSLVDARATTAADLDHGADPDARASAPSRGVATVDLAGSTDLGRLFAALAVAVARLGQHDRVVIGLDTDLRGLPELLDQPGPFAKTLPTVIDCPPAATMAELCAEATSALHLAESVVDTAPVAAARSLLTDPGLVRLSWCPARAHPVEEGTVLRLSRLVATGSRRQLHVTAVTTDGGLRVTLAADPDRYSQRRLDTLAAAITAAWDAPGAITLGEFDALAGAERRLAVRPAGDRTEAPPWTVCTRLVDAGTRNPDAPAVRDHAGMWTYRELLATTADIAYGLRARGVGPGDVVCLALPRGRQLIAATLAVLRAGGVFLAVEDGPAHPDAALVVGAAPGCVTWDELCADGPAVPLDRAGPDDLAYLVATSGSTGAPKLIAVEHGNLASYVDAVVDRLGVEPGWSSLMVSALSVDLGMTALFPLLLTGGCVTALPADTTRDPKLLAAWARHNPVDLLKITPTHLRAALTAGPDILPQRLLVCGGEQLDWDLVAEVRAHRPGLRVVNHYGPAETTVGVYTFEAGPGRGPQRTVPIGTPLPGVSAEVRDSAGRPVPVGGVGELRLGGRQLSRGYRGGEQLPEHSDGWYHTGDLVRLLPDGGFEHIGRQDRQVKLRGYRVDLAGVERAVEEAAGAPVRVAVVVDGEHRMVAFVAAEEPVDVGAVRQRLAGRYPAHLVPSRIQQIFRLPLGPSGKVDYQALPVRATVSTRHGDPVTALWCELLGVADCRDDEGFFAAGGDSLLALQLVARLVNEHGIRVSLADILAGRTLGELRAMRPDVPAGLLHAFPYSRSGRVLYVVHGVEGLVHPFEELARELAPDVAVVAVRGRRWAGLPPLATVRELAAEYLRAVRERSASGPWAIAGWSFGGLVAYEMARQLVHDGEEVDLLCLMDSFLPGPRGAQPDPEVVARTLGGDEPGPELIASVRDHLASSADFMPAPLPPGGVPGLTVRTTGSRHTLREPLTVPGEELVVDGSHRDVLAGSGVRLIAGRVRTILQRSAKSGGQVE